jgi:hypothetical protein
MPRAAAVLASSNAAAKRSAAPRRGSRNAQVLERMADVGEHVAVGPIAVLVAGAPEHGSGDDERGCPGQHRVASGTEGCSVREAITDALERVPLRVVVPRPGRKAGQALHHDVQLGREQRPRRRRGAKLQAAAHLADAGAMPEHGAEGADAGRIAAIAAAARQGDPRSAWVELEQRRRIAPVDPGRAQEHAGAGVRRDGVEALHQRQRCRPGVGPEPALAWRTRDELGPWRVAPVAQAERKGGARREHGAEHPEHAAPARGGNRGVSAGR